MRKKMYKKGKFWVVATIAAVATVVGAETVKADEEVNTNSSASVSTENTLVATKSTDNVPSQASVVSASASTDRAVTSSATTDSLTTSVPSTEPSDSSVSTTTSSTLDNKVVVKEDNRASAVPATSNEEQPSSSVAEEPHRAATGGSASDSTEQTSPSATVHIENIDNKTGSYDVVISNVVAPKGMNGIVVPTWTDNNGQDDIIWGNATKQADGSYRYTVKSDEHKGEGGLYNSHVYIVEKDGHFAWGGGKQVTLNLPKASATVSIENVNNTAGTYDVVISNLVTPKGVQRIVVPTWTDNKGQDDIIWNNAVKQTDGTYRLTIKASDHRWESGKYHSHVYIVENNGNFAWGGGVTATLNIPRSSIKSVITPTYKGTGGYDVRIDFAPEQGEVLFAVWSEKNGQDDLIWYSAKHANDGSYQGFFNAQNHKDTGVYNIHAYQKLNGQMNFLAATTIDVAQSTYSAPYYSQRDARWGGTVYGVGNMHDTGCVPTTLAMAISAIKEKAVLPTEIADYLYHNTDTFNKRFAGSSGKAIALASQHWGLSSTVLSSEDDISRALADGHYVTAAVGGGSFTSGFVTHEILLKGNVDGKTYVLDPYTPSNNRWFPISYISSIRSTDKDDNSEGAPFFKITDI